MEKGCNNCIYRTGGTGCDKRNCSECSMFSDSIGILCKCAENMIKNNGKPCEYYKQDVYVRYDKQV